MVQRHTKLDAPSSTGMVLGLPGPDFPLGVVPEVRPAREGRGPTPDVPDMILAKLIGIPWAPPEQREVEE